MGYVIPPLCEATLESSLAPPEKMPRRREGKMAEVAKCEEWYRGVRRHGLIMGCSVTGVKTEAGPGPLYTEPSEQKEQVQAPKSNPLSFLIRMILGCIGGFYYTLVPIYMWIKNLIFPKSWEI
ncbi:hypothetical protein CYMTET_49607 [Cymbomonas tetramitiformis]|uniref:Uncharacterized protein n=1 Tax=Cymbomonas tetramitiformis TaxID=36881 RepID=A0AAE0BR02_9CHLO|nr:hypothetical protein CYMTET_49607 [Cymbomonas tetramitiformis]